MKGKEITFERFQAYFKNMRKSLWDKTRIKFENDEEKRQYIAYTSVGIFLAPHSGSNLTWKHNGHCLMTKVAW